MNLGSNGLSQMNTNYHIQLENNLKVLMQKFSTQQRFVNNYWGKRLKAKIKKV